MTNAAPTPVRVMVATPLYGGAEADYLRAVVGLTGAGERAGAGFTFVRPSNSASIDRARDVLAGAFLQSDAAHLLSDDYAFCCRVRDPSYRIWLAPWMRTTHTGPALSAGALSDLAALSAVPA